MPEGTWRVGLVGAGTMGLLVGTSLSEAGHEVVVYDPSLRSQMKAREAGLTLTESVRELAERTNESVIFLVLPGPAQIEEVVAGADGILASGHRPSVIVDMSTSSPANTRRMSEAAAQNGIEYLDAPILGRPRSVGRWSLPVGGDAEALDYCRPLLECFASRVVHVGQSGTGHTLKLLNALMFGAINAITAETLAISQKAGLPPETLFRILTESEAATVSGLFREVAPRIVERDFDPTFSIDLLCKDNSLGLEMAREFGATPVVGTTVQMVNEMARSQGLGGKDTSALVLLYERFFGPEDGKETTQ